MQVCRSPAKTILSALTGLAVLEGVCVEVVDTDTVGLGERSDDVAVADGVREGEGETPNAFTMQHANPAELKLISFSRPKYPTWT
jgi:hypothetical protein